MSAVTAEITCCFESLGLVADPLMLERLEEFHRLLTDANRRMDLTNVPDGEMPRRHYLDSMLPALTWPELFSDSDTLLDVGSGAGFPGIPLAILKPQMSVTLLESMGKRCAFLHDTARRLGLERVRVLESRAETAGHRAEYRERFSLTVSRAVAGLPELLEYMLPLTAAGGKALCWKGGKAASELESARSAALELGGGDMECFRYMNGDEQSFLVRIDKTAVTPDRYPRRAGIPHKRPLG